MCYDVKLKFIDVVFITACGYDVGRACVLDVNGLLTWPRSEGFRA